MTERRKRPKRWTTAHSRFCAAVARTGNAAEAFREAWPERAGRVKETSIHEMASHLMADHKVQSRIRAIQERAAEIAHITFASHLQQMGRLREIAVRKGQLSAAIRAEEGRAKVAGLYASDAPLRTPAGKEGELVVGVGDVPADAEVARALLTLQKVEREAGKTQRQEIPS